MAAILETGTIIRRRIAKVETGKTVEAERGEPANVPYTMKFLNESYLEQVLNLQEMIVQNLPSPDLLQPFAPDFMRQHVRNKGRIIGVFADNELIAFRALYFPDMDDHEWNLGFDIGLQGSELAKVANLQMVCVNPLYRGNQLGLKMNRHAIRFLKEETDYIHLCATVHPRNRWNVRVLMKSGFVIRNLKEKYGGKLRYIVYQNLRGPIKIISKDKVFVKHVDIDEQKKVLKRGFLGIDILESPQGFQVVFAK
jgi:RimJ/RimL family protein N-acetyltransferase